MPLVTISVPDHRPALWRKKVADIVNAAVIETLDFSAGRSLSADPGPAGGTNRTAESQPRRGRAATDHARRPRQPRRPSTGVLSMIWPATPKSSLPA